VGGDVPCCVCEYGGGGGGGIVKGEVPDLEELYEKGSLSKNVAAIWVSKGGRSIEWGSWVARTDI